jgi:prepilin-type N-terminal cleavage/methylation domain-containing protein/prepilin-type processing-associated H-X9-DG protein
MNVKLNETLGEVIFDMKKSVQERPRGFTLIELLVVIAIIAVLASILLPAISRVRASAESTQCVSNLRNMQIANQMYAAQNKNKFLSGASFDENSDLSTAWLVNSEYFELLTNLSLEREWGEWNEDLLCPTTRSMGSPDYDLLSANYGINYMLLQEALDLPAWGDESASWSIPAYKIKNPAETVAFADCTDWLLKALEGYSTSDEEANGYNSAGYLAFRHNGRANVVNFDGSVNSYTAEDLTDPEIQAHFTLLDVD